MNYELIKIRVVAFAYQAGTTIVLAIIASVASPEFHAIITENFGTGITGMLVVLITDGIVKQVRNVMVLGRAARLGSYGKSVTLV